MDNTNKLNQEKSAPPAPSSGNLYSDYSPPPLEPVTPTPEIPSDQIPPAESAAPQTPAYQPSAVSAQIPLPQSSADKFTKSKAFKTILGALSFLAIGSWGFASYLFLTNKSLRQNKSAVAVITPTQKTIVPTVKPLPPKFETENGNIIKIEPSGDVSILISKEDYPATGLIGFTDVVTSPDNQKICFWSLPPALDPTLYFSQTGQASVAALTPKGKACSFSGESDKIAFIEDTPAGKPVDIYVYEISSQKSTNLTNQVEGSVYRRYQIEGWKDNQTILCNFEQIDLEDTATEISGRCEINTVSGEISEI